MHYMNNQTFEYPNIQELNLDEIEKVDGDIATLVVAGIVVGVVIVVGFAAGAISGYLSNHNG